MAHAKVRHKIVTEPGLFAVGAFGYGCAVPSATRRPGADREMADTGEPCPN